MNHVLQIVGGGRWVRPRSHESGMMMLEVVVAMGVAAMLLPMALMLMSASGDAVRASRMESVSLWVLPWCIERFDAAAGSKVFAVTGDGLVAGTVGEDDYRSGVVACDGRAVRYLCRMEAAEEGDEDAGASVPVVVAFEEPARAPAGKRLTLTYHTRMK